MAGEPTQVLREQYHTPVTTPGGLPAVLFTKSENFPQPEAFYFWFRQAIFLLLALDNAVC